MPKMAQKWSKIRGFARLHGFAMLHFSLYDPSMTMGIRPFNIDMLGSMNVWYMTQKREEDPQLLILSPSARIIGSSYPFAFLVMSISLFKVVLQWLMDTFWTGSDSKKVKILREGEGRRGNMAGQIMQTMAFTQIIAILTPGRSLEDHLNRLRSTATPTTGSLYKYVPAGCLTTV